MHHISSRVHTYIRTYIHTYIHMYISFTVVPTFQLLYMTLAVIKMDGYGFSNTAHRERLTKVMQYYIFTERLPDSSNKLEHFSYKGE